MRVVDHPHDRLLLQRLAAGPVSGSTLAHEAGQTRAAIWKRIAVLREAGIVIDAVPGTGYRLAGSLDLLAEADIRAAMPEQTRRQLSSLDIAWTVDSTNSELLRREAPGTGCAVLLAERQTGGRGRRGRQWASPLAAHVYLSLSRRFAGGLARLGGLSLVAGVACCEALHALGYSQVQLKWPNDLVVREGDGLRKLGGLLVEGGGEAAGAARAVIGIGLNVRMPAAMAAEIDQPWVDLDGLDGSTPDRNAVVGALLAHLVPASEAFDAQGLSAFMSRYARHDALAGRKVRVLDATQTWDATATGIAEDGALQVRDADGLERRVHAGDVSIRP